jgi:hypothetical protein
MDGPLKNVSKAHRSCCRHPDSLHAETEIRSGGAWTRTVALTRQQTKDMGRSTEESFLLPSGDGWKSRTEKKNSDHTTLEKTFAVGAQLKGDLSVKEGGSPMLANEVPVIVFLSPVVAWTIRQLRYFKSRLSGFMFDREAGMESMCFVSQ